jgi:hypothetical protein
MKIKYILLLAIIHINFGFAQKINLTKENILKEGTVFTYVVANLYKSTGIGHPILEREKKDTIKFYIKKEGTILKVFKDSLNSNGLTLATENSAVFRGLLDINFEKTSKKYQLLLNKKQYYNNSLSVDEGTLNPRIYKKSDKTIDISFLLNGHIVRGKSILFTEKVNPMDISLSYAFLQNKDFPIQIYQNFADKKYTYAMTFRLAEIKTTN